MVPTLFVSKIVKGYTSEPVEFSLETPPDPKFGDLATNAALVLAKQVGKNPRELATEIAQKISQNKFVAKTEIAGPGFINIFLAPEFFHSTFVAIEKAGSDFAQSKIGKGQK
ncbi:MAG: arginine--tRNA ligase, partial [Patescibacteria group bacterium]